MPLFAALEAYISGDMTLKELLERIAGEVKLAGSASAVWDLISADSQKTFLQKCCKHKELSKELHDSYPDSFISEDSIHKKRKHPNLNNNHGEESDAKRRKLADKSKSTLELLSGEFATCLEDYIAYIRVLISNGLKDRFEILICLFKEQYLTKSYVNSNKVFNRFFPILSKGSYQAYVKKFLLPALAAGDVPAHADSFAELAALMEPDGHDDYSMGIDAVLKPFEHGFSGDLNEQTEFILVWIAYFTFFPHALDPLVKKMSGITLTPAVSASRAASLLKHSWMMANIYEQEKLSAWHKSYLTRYPQPLSESPSQKNDCYSYAYLTVHLPSDLLTQLFDGLLALLKDQDFKVRYSASEALGEFTNLSSDLFAPVIARLLVFFNDEDWHVRLSACKFVGKFTNLSSDFSAQLIDRLLELFNDEDWTVRQSACKTVGKFTNLPAALLARVINGLLALFDDQDWDVRQSAFETIGKFTNLPSALLERFIPRLLALVDNKVPKVRRAAYKALASFSNLSETQYLKVINHVMQRLADGVKDDNFLRILCGSSTKSAELVSRWIRFYQDDCSALSQIADSRSIALLPLDEKIVLKALLYEPCYSPIVNKLNDAITTERLLMHQAVPQEISHVIMRFAHQ